MNPEILLEEEYSKLSLNETICFSECKFCNKEQDKLVTDENKLKIIEIFLQNIKGKQFEDINNKHCGKEGHWLETKMGISHNSKNEPDLYGYEMKKDSSKITFGDFSASEYLFSKNKEYIIQYNNWNDIELPNISKNDFIQYFGTPNEKKKNRYSWSGKCVPSYNIWNMFGQILQVDENNNIYVLYSFEKDTRENKNTLPKILQKENIMIAFWKENKIRNHIDNKFNINGFFICKKTNGIYDKICFGKKFDYNYFIECIKNGIIIFDSGMYQSNSRNYSLFRSNMNNFWSKLITEEF